MLVVKEYAILYTVSAVFVLLVHTSDNVDYGMLNKIRDFFGAHVIPYIPFPFIGGIVDYGVSSFVSIYSGALSNGGEAITDVYRLMPDKLKSMYNLNFHFAEVVAVVVVLMLLYIYLFSAISFVTNMYNDDMNRILYLVICVVAFFMMLGYALYIKIVKEWVDLAEKNNKFVTIVNYVIVAIVGLFVMMALAVAYNYRADVKDFAKTAKLVKGVIKSKIDETPSEFAKILSIFKDCYPLFPLLFAQGILTMALQFVFATYQLFVTGGLGIDPKREKVMRVFITHVYLLITVVMLVIMK